MRTARRARLKNSRQKDAASDAPKGGNGQNAFLKKSDEIMNPADSLEIPKRVIRGGNAAKDAPCDGCVFYFNRGDQRAVMANSTSPEVISAEYTSTETVSPSRSTRRVCRPTIIRRASSSE